MMESEVMKVSPPSKRIEELKRIVLETKPSLCWERAVLVTEAYKKYEGFHPKILRAKVLEYLLNNMSTYILPGELIVGALASKPRAAPLYPEFDIDVIKYELDTISTRKYNPFEVDEVAKEKLRSIISYWDGRTHKDKVWANLPEEVKKARKAGLFTLGIMETGGIGHYVPDLPTLLKLGWKGIKERCEEKLRQIDLSDGRNYEKYLFWQACVITSNAVSGFIKRYAKLAKELAEKEADARRRKELEQIAVNCEWIAENPPRTFWEALQLVWFAHLIQHIDVNGVSVSPGHLDRILLPYYKRDIENGILTKELAQDLIDNFWLKFNEINKVYTEEDSKYRTGNVMFQNINLGGIDENGDPAENELTRLMLIAEMHIHAEQPQLTLWIHDRTPDDVMFLAIENMKMGGGKPQLLGVKSMAKSMVRLGVPPREAKWVTSIGCVECGVIGAHIQGNTGYLNFAKVVELTLNNGRDMFTGELIGIETGDPKEFRTFDEFFEAFKKQLRYAMRLMALENHVIETLWRDFTPHIYQSMLTPDCLERGLTIHEGGAKYEWRNPGIIGTGTAVDSIIAVKYLIYDEHITDMETLIKALKANWVGYENLRRLALNALKYGNDDEYADEIVRKVTNVLFDITEEFKSITGATYAGPMLMSLSSYVPFGYATAATPDGRGAREPLSDGISPSRGMERNGPTAVIKSVGKIEHWRTTGTTLNMKFSPSVLSSTEGMRRFADFIKTYLVDLEGSHIQFNVVSSSILKEAQKNPEKYKWLLVRVAGYSAYFVYLSKDVQDEIIARTEWEELR